MGSIHSYKDLDVWKKSFAFSVEIYKITTAFPSEEKFGITSQIRRAAVSIPSNIAEGWSRKSTKSYIQFLNIASGSLAESETLLQLSHELKYISDEVNAKLQKLLDDIGRMLNALITSLKNKMRSQELESPNSKFPIPNS
jgi:four helix bundle protein